MLKLCDADLCELSDFEVVQMVREMFEASIVWLVIVLSERSLPQEHVHYSQLWWDVHRVQWVYAQVKFSFFEISWFLFLF